MRPQVESRQAIPLTGADCMLRAFDAEIRRSAGANHVSQLVLRLGPGFDLARFERLVAQVTLAQPILRAPIGRRFGVGAPVYRVADAADCPMPPVRVTQVSGPPPEVLPKTFSDLLNERMAPERGELLRFDLVRYDQGRAGTDLVMSWMHMLFDGSGSETFVRWLEDCYRGESRPNGLPCPTELDPAPPASSLQERGEAARSWQQNLSRYASRPAGSLAGPLRREPQSLSVQRLTLTPAETQHTSEQAVKRAGFLTPMLFYLAASMRAHHAVLRERNAVPQSYVVPVAVNLRRKGAAKAMFRTHVSMLWFQALPEQVEDLDGLVAGLKEQRLEAIQAKLIEHAVDAMDFARFAPARLYTHLARRDFKGELASFFFAFTSEFLKGMDRFCAAEIRDGFHVAPVPPSPGSCVAIHLRGGCLNATHTYQRGVLSAPEHRIFLDQLRSDFQG